jgi:hypothetical protein
MADAGRTEGIMSESREANAWYHPWAIAIAADPVVALLVKLYLSQVLRKNTAYPQRQWADSDRAHVPPRSTSAFSPR